MGQLSLIFIIGCSRTILILKQEQQYEHKKKVIKNLESAINRICEDINKKKAGSGADKLDSLAKLVNSFGRLIERKKVKEYDKMIDGDKNFTNVCLNQENRIDEE